MWQLCTAVSLGCILGLWGFCFFVLVLLFCFNVGGLFVVLVPFFFLDMDGAFFVLLN